MPDRELVSPPAFSCQTEFQLALDNVRARLNSEPVVRSNEDAGHSIESNDDDDGDGQRVFLPYACDCQGCLQGRNEKGTMYAYAYPIACYIYWPARIIACYMIIAMPTVCDSCCLLQRIYLFS